MKKMPNKTNFDQSANDSVFDKDAESAFFRRNRTLRMISSSNQELVRSTDEMAFLKCLSRIIVEEGGYRMAWIGYAEHDERRTVRPVAKMGAEDGYIDALDITWADDERGRCPTGTAIRTGEVSVSHSIADDKCFAPWRDEAVKQGFVSSIALPLNTDGELIGALNIYSDQRDAFDEEEIALLKKLAGDISFGIIGLRKTKKLRESEELYRLISSVAFNYVFSTRLEDDGSFHLNWIEGAFEKMTGYTIEEFGEHGGWRASVHPDDLDQADRDMELLRSNRKIIREIRTMKKLGDVLWVCIYAYPVWDEQQHRLTGIYGAVQDITERKAAENALRESEIRFNTAFRYSPIALALTSIPDNKYVDVNHIFLQTTGFSRDEVIGRTSEELRIFEKDDDRGELFAQVQKEGHVYDKELRFRIKSGKILTCLISMSVIKIAGQPHFLSSVVDITERIEAEESRAEREQLYRTLFNLSPASILLLDSLGCILELNDAVCKTYGYKREELLGKNVRILVPAEQHAQVEKNIAEILSGKVLHHEVVNIGKMGTIHLADLRETAVPLPGGGMGILTHWTDITERKRTENALRESEQLFRLISENVADMIVVLDLEGKRIYNSPSYRPILGETELLKGTDSFLEVHPDDREKIVNIFRETVRTGVGHQVEYRMIGKGNTVHFIESMGSVIRDNEGKITNVIVVGRDITEKKRLQEQSFRTQRMESLGTLASGVAHDLNNVLGPIVLAIEVIKGRVTDKAAIKMLDMLAISSRRGADIVRQILGFARGMEGERTLLQPRYLIKETIRIIGETFPKGITVKTDLPKETWTITGDSTQIQQVVLNLCVNARDAMPQGGMLTISVGNIVIDESYARTIGEAKPGKFVELTVTDTGTGIPPEVVEHIFEPFYTTKERGKGTGLGLSTVHAIVKSHGGFIAVDSEVGKGTSFKVFFPTEETVIAEKIREDHREIFSGNGEVILVIDDEESILEITKQTLEAFNYSVLTAKNGVEAVAVYKRNKERIALVITDMMMPKMGGYQTIHVLRSLNENLKIIASSGLASEEFANSDDTAKPDIFMTKPYKADKLLETIANLLKGKGERIS
jgi:PAS domain S-box-containing protein